MIQTQELRIGNLLDVEGNIIKVGKIDENLISWNIAKDTAKFNIWNPFLPISDKRISPIPLTEEILLKFGLKKIDDNLWQYKNGYLIGFYTKRWFIGKYNFDDMVEMITSFYYAHQLQNLYFALTGEELTFNIFVKNA